MLLNYAAKIHPISNGKSLVFLSRSPTKKNLFSGAMDGSRNVVDIYINEELIGQLDHVGGLLLDYESGEEIKLTIMEDGKLKSTVKFKTESNKVYQLDYLYSSSVLVMKGD